MLSCFYRALFQQSLAYQKPFDQQWAAIGEFAELALFKLFPRLTERRFFLWFIFCGARLFTLDQFSLGLNLKPLYTQTEFFDCGLSPRRLTKRAQAIDEQNSEAMFPGPALP